MTILEAIHQVCAGLPRHSPGSEPTTLKALRRLGRLSRHLRVIDLGCGTGVATQVLARRFDGPIVALDAHGPFLEGLRAEVAAEGGALRVDTLHADFTALASDFGEFNLLWAEAASYVMGFERSLTAWWPILAAGGHAAITELCYLVDQPCDEVTRFVSSIHPTVSTVSANRAAAERSGYTVVDTLVLSNRDYRAYYNPIKARIAVIRASGEVSAEAAVVIAELEAEMGLHQRCGDEFGWVFFLLAKPAGLAGESDEFGNEADDVAFEPEVESSELSTRAVKRGGSSSRGFDAEVAPSNRVAYQKTEQRLVELIRDCGLKRASQVLSEVETEVSRVVKTGRSG